MVLLFEALLIECDLKLSVFIPAGFSRKTIYWASEDDERRNLSFSLPVKDSVLDIYTCKASFGHSLLSEEDDGHVKGLSGLDGQDNFDKQAGSNWIPSDSNLIAF